MLSLALFVAGWLAKEGEAQYRTVPALVEHHDGDEHVLQHSAFRV